MTGFNVRVNHHVSPTQSAPIEVTDLWQKSLHPELKEGAAQKIIPWSPSQQSLADCCRQTSWQSPPKESGISSNAILIFSVNVWNIDPHQELKNLG